MFPATKQTNNKKYIYIFPISQKSNTQKIIIIIIIIIINKKIAISQKIFCSENKTGPIYVMFDCMNMQSKNGDGEKTIDLKEWMDQSENKYKETTLPALCVWLGIFGKREGFTFPA